MKKRLFAVIALLSVLGMSACLPYESPQVTPTPLPPTETATLTPTTTATIVWFPPTATFTPGPTLQVIPTIDERPTRGNLLLEDSFTDKTHWQTGRTSAGSVGYGKSELTLAVSDKQGVLLSLRKTPQLTNFFLEVDAQPSLCRGGDIYGLLLRASSAQDFYRLMLSCNGQVRLERVKNARVTPLQDWQPSGQLLPGGMLRTKIGVWALGEQLRFYINDEFQFAIKDPVFPSGALGVYARSAGDTPLTVSFSNLVVYQLDAGSSVSPPDASSQVTVTPAGKPAVAPNP